MRGCNKFVTSKSAQGRGRDNELRVGHVDLVTGCVTGSEGQGEIGADPCPHLGRCASTDHMWKPPSKSGVPVRTLGLCSSLFRLLLQHHLCSLLCVFRAICVFDYLSPRKSL